MNNLNNLYNFKNPIRHFFNIDNIKFDSVEELKFKDLSWTKPVKFKIFKTKDSIRTISFPNILNFYHTVKKFTNIPNFYDIKKLSAKKRVSPDLDIGEFSVLSYNHSIQRDLYNLTKFDKLLILDIKSFYGRIYTHELGYKYIENNEDKNLEQRITSLNQGKTNGILLGSYLSLFLAEWFLMQIENKLSDELSTNNITCHYEYYSDDFYFFCNDKDINTIKSIFSKVLDEYDLQYNEDKVLLLDFEEYSRNNNLDKLWKKIINISYCKDQELIKKSSKDKVYLKYPAFFTQIVYRLDKINELKYKRVFIVNFFKTEYFKSLKANTYLLSKSDFNYLCYIYKLMPESILYSLDKIMNMKEFDHNMFKAFIELRFKSSLETEKHEEQLYFYYAIKTCGYHDLLKKFKDKVLKSDNQILISYFLIDRVINKEDYLEFLENPQESNWLQNYHYLLVYNDSNINILLPKFAKNNQKNSYNIFYKNNITKQISIVKPIEKINDAINRYLDKKIKSFKSIELS